jgi:hypothetical protein
VVAEREARVPRRPVHEDLVGLDLEACLDEPLDEARDLLLAAVVARPRALAGEDEADVVGVGARERADVALVQALHVAPEERLDHGSVERRRRGRDCHETCDASHA